MAQIHLLLISTNLHHQPLRQRSEAIKITLLCRGIPQAQRGDFKRWKRLK